MGNSITDTKYPIVETANQRAALNLDVILKNKSKNTNSQFKATWKLYSEWCQVSGLAVWDIDPVQAQLFLMAHPARPSTQRLRLSQLRTILKLHAKTAENPALEYRYGLMSIYTLPTEAEHAMYAEIRNRHAPKALQADEIYAELNREWATTELTIRNRAIIALLFYAALRRSEVCKLKWSDVNGDDRTISILGGKKREIDHTDYVPLLPQVERRLQMWWELAQGRTYVFCRVDRTGKLLEDKPLSGESIRQICGTEFRPHDGRRTLGTRSIENGTPVNVAQQTLRHLTPAMTLEYAKYVESKQLADKLKLGY